MDTYHFKLAGPGRERVAIKAASVAEARNAAVQYLGRYLGEHPGFADEGHWQLNVENASGQSLLHIIVATVVPRHAVADSAAPANGEEEAR